MMSMSELDPLACALFLIGAFVLAGVAQTAWFRSPRSRAFAVPLDGRLRWRGRRVFGDNKTLRGIVVMVPAAAAAFVLLSWLTGRGDPPSAGLWPMTAAGYAAVGAWAGLGFMLGELPNSFVKRQLGIEPGCAPGNSAAALVQFAADRLDSGIGMLLALAVVVPVPLETCAIVLMIGPIFHWTFSAAMFRMGLKARRA
jgi:CDP-2,3-bis-(O-geranylgeranyl)-sn-glycerol synthase